MGYLDAFVPSGNRNSRSVKTSWSGLDRKHTQDAGTISKAFNIATTHLPFLRVAESNTTKMSFLGREIYGIYDVGDGNFVATYLMRKDAVEPGKADLFLCYVRADGSQVHTQTPIQAQFPYNDGVSISVVPFNVYENKDDNIAAATYVRKILVYPFAKSFDPPMSGDMYLTLSDINTPPAEGETIGGNYVPLLEHAAVHMGRVFGTIAGKVYASAWNNYADFTLPNADDAASGANLESMAWMSTTQSDVNASGEFTAIAVYDNHVVGFKRNFMHQIYNNKNPFRIADIARVGALSQEAVCECNRTLFFVSEDGIYAYTGGYPECISDNLEISSFEGAVLGADDRVLYCYIPGECIFTFDTVTSSWSANYYESGAPVMFCKNDNGCLYGVKVDATTSEVRRIGGGECGAFLVETDVSYGGALSEKRILRLRLQVERLDGETGSNEDYVSLSLIHDPSGKRMLTKRVSTDRKRTYMISLAVRNTVAFGHKVRIEGHGNFEIRYLQIDYEEGGERYV